MFYNSDILLDVVNRSVQTYFTKDFIFTWLITHDKHFILFNDPPAINNPINTRLTNPNIILNHAFSLNIY